MSEVDPAEGRGDHRRALAHLEDLAEDTMRHAWGEGTSAEDRRRMVLAAIVFGRQFEERAEKDLPVEEQDRQRFLMSLMNAVIGEFAVLEGMSRDAATAFLSDVTIRDYVLEFDEVLDAYRADDTGRNLDELFREAIDGRPRKARWADHWSSG